METGDIFKKRKEHFCFCLDVQVTFWVCKGFGFLNFLSISPFFLISIFLASSKTQEKPGPKVSWRIGPYAETHISKTKNCGRGSRIRKGGY